MKVAAVIFDMDGLMVDTEPLYQAAWQQTASELGYRLDDELYAKFVGRPNEACEDLLMEEYGASFPLDRFRARWPMLWQSQMDRLGVQTKPGLLDLLAFVDEQRWPASIEAVQAAFRVVGTLHEARDVLASLISRTKTDD